MFREEKLRDKLLKELSKNELSEIECRKLFESDEEYVSIKNWLWHKELVGFRVNGNIHLTHYGKFFTKNGSFFWPKMWPIAIGAITLLIAVGSLWYSRLSYEEAKKASTQQSETPKKVDSLPHGK